jgi:HD superfamily phosphohydrolase
MSSTDAPSEGYYFILFGNNKHLYAKIPLGSTNKFIFDITSKIEQKYYEEKKTKIYASKIMSEIIKRIDSSKTRTEEEELAKSKADEEIEKPLEKAQLKSIGHVLKAVCDRVAARKRREEEELAKSIDLLKSMKEYSLHLDTYNEINRLYSGLERSLGQLNEAKYDDNYWNGFFNAGTDEGNKHRKDTVSHFERMVEIWQTRLDNLLNSSPIVTDAVQAGGGMKE